jgi:hypothetical protein
MPAGEWLPAVPARVQAGDLMPVLDIKVALERRLFMARVTKELMIESVDYGKVPGTEKPTLLKPGAERLNTLYGFTPHFEEIVALEDWSGRGAGEGEPLFFYKIRCTLAKNGIVFGEGIGSCSSRESKYRFRWVPEAEVLELGYTAEQLKAFKRRGGIRQVFEPDFALQKKETGGKYGKPVEYWERFSAMIQAGTARRVERTLGKREFQGYEISIDETLYRLPNPEIADTVNTISKMAQKRALIAATLIATNASEFFTQDLEDFAHYEAPASPAAESEPAETPEQVKERRIREEQQKAAAKSSPAPAAESPAAEPAPPKTELDHMIEGCTSQAGIRQALDVLLDRLTEYLGEEKAGLALARLLTEENLGSIGDAYKRVGTAKKFVRALYQRCETFRPKGEPPADANAALPAQRNPEVTDADLPAGLFGEAGAKDTTYQD